MHGAIAGIIYSFFTHPSAYWAMHDDDETLPIVMGFQSWEDYELRVLDYMSGHGDVYD